MSNVYHMTPNGPERCTTGADCIYPAADRHNDKQALEEAYRHDMDTIHRMTRTLHDAAQAYYQGDGDSGMTDDEYDAGILYLRTMAGMYDLSDDTVLMDLLDGRVAGGTEILDKSVTRVHHDVPMLSLAKANNRTEVEDYVKKMIASGATGFKLQAKFDGIACSAVYHDGTLTQMSTRGNGQDGEDMSYLINNRHVRIDGLPTRLNGHDVDVEIRGELFLRPSEFKALNEERVKRGEPEFANPRNTNAGIVKKAAKGDSDDAVLQFVMYRIIGGGVAEHDLIQGGVAEASILTGSEWLGTGVDIPGGSLTVPLAMDDAGNVDVDATTNVVMGIVDAFEPVRGMTDLSLDGIVIKPLNEREMDDRLGSNAHSPLSQVAFKYPGATGITRIIGVSVTVGKSGRVTPTAILDPVEVDGVTIGRATLHNYDWARKKRIAIGSTVVVERRHDVIPAIAEVIDTPDGSEVIEEPSECPYCGTGIVDGYCPNVKCPSRGSFMLKNAVGKNALDFDGLGGKVVEALHDAGLVDTVADFYDLTVDDLAGAVVGVDSDGTARRFGDKRAMHVMSHIEKSRELPYHRVLSSLSIPDLGVQTAKVLARKFISIDELKSASVEDIATVDGLGEVTARKIKNGLDEQWLVIERLRKAGLRFSEAGHGDAMHDDADANPRRALNGLKLSITGRAPDGYANRGEWREFVESMGGVAQPSPRSDTDYLVWDGAKRSSKLDKAFKYGVKVISPDDFAKGVRSGALPAHSTFDGTGSYIG